MTIPAGGAASSNGPTASGAGTMSSDRHSRDGRRRLAKRLAERGGSYGNAPWGNVVECSLADAVPDSETVTGSDP